MRISKSAGMPKRIDFYMLSPSHSITRCIDMLKRGDRAAAEALWDSYVHRLVSSGLIERVAFSPDGRRLATSGWDGIVRLIDVDTGHEVLALRGHSDRVWGVNFSPRGDAIVSASADGKVLLWNAKHPGRSASAE